MVLIKGFYYLCKEKKLFQNATSVINLSKKLSEISKNDDFYKNILACNENFDDTGEVEMGWFWFGEWVLIATASLGVGVAYNTLSYTDVTTETFTQNSSCMSIWNVLSNEKNANTFIVDEFQRNFVNDAIEILKIEKPILFEKFDEEQLKSFIIKNLNK